MQGTTQHRGARRTRGGCPPILEIDLVQSEHPLAPPVEWPEGPVSELTTARAVRLLDAAVAHLRTALETTTDPQQARQVEDAITDASRALEHLDGLAD